MEPYFKKLHSFHPGFFSSYDETNHLRKEVEVCPTNILYHEFGIRGYRYKRSCFQQGALLSPLSRPTMKSIVTASARPSKQLSRIVVTEASSMVLSA
jgi:hypothetical protein